MEGLGDLVILELALMVDLNAGRATCPKVDGGAFIALAEKWPLHTVCPVWRPVWPAWGPAWRAEACLQSGRPGARLNRPGSRLAARTARPVARFQPAWEPAALPSHPASSPVWPAWGPATQPSRPAWSPVWPAWEPATQGTAHLSEFPKLSSF